MCGIAGFHVKDPAVIKKHEAVELFVDELLKGIEHRGKHASGFVSVGFDGEVRVDKAPKEATEFIKDRERIPEGVRTVLLHTRYATLGGPEHQENNHPVVFGSCFATHNGHINNHAELYEELGLTRNAEVDSSVIAAAAEYHGVGELDDIRSTLEALEGPMACAIINPVTHRGRVILAKGAQSPLYVVETNKFIIWASTKATIEDAWGKVFGTPPNKDKIENVTEGNFIVIDDSDVKREKFTVKRRPFASPSYQGATRSWNGKQHGRNGSGFGFRTETAPSVDATPVERAKEAIREFIREGGTARHFDAHNNGEYADEAFLDVVGDRQWWPCYGCNRLVLKEDRIKHEDWGTICCDCYTVTKREIARAQMQMQDTEDHLAGTSIPRISSGDRDALEVWADHERRMHLEVLDELSKACGSYYSPQAIEFLCFYTSAEYRDVAGNAVNALITELRDAYEEAYLDIVSGNWEHESCEVPASEPLLLEAGATSWRFCYAHNRPYHEGEGCSACDDEAQLEGEARLAAMLDGRVEDESEAETPAPATTEIGIQLPFERGRDSVITNSNRTYTRSSGRTKEDAVGDGSASTGGEVIELPRCGACGTFVLRATEESCVVCRQSEANGRTHEKPVCTACGSVEPRFIVAYANRNYYYCRSCYKHCGKLVKNDDHLVSLCHNETNHMLRDGVRVCHQHARRQSNVLSDTTLRKRGAMITEV